MTKGPVIVYRPGIEEFGGKVSHGFQGEWRWDVSMEKLRKLLCYYHGWEAVIKGTFDCGTSHI